MPAVTGGRPAGPQSLAGVPARPGRFVPLLLLWVLFGGFAASPARAESGDGAGDRPATGLELDAVGGAEALFGQDDLAGPDGRLLAGEWLTESGKSRVEIYPAAGATGVYEGRIVSGQDGPGAPLDARNPNPALRRRPVKGIVFMTGFRYAGNGRYEGGRIYDPQSGNVYRGSLRLVAPDTLLLRGYLGLSLFGATQTWKRLPAQGHATGAVPEAQRAAREYGGPDVTTGSAR